MLSRGTNLTTITCFPFDSYVRHPRPDEPGLIILKGLVDGFLFHDNGNDSEKFIWEEHFKLKRVSVSYQTWDIASTFGKLEKGMKKAKKMESGDGKREVLYRDISGTTPNNIHTGYDPDFAWAEKVAKDIA